MDIKDLTGLGEPIKRLIEVVAESVGVISRPYFIKQTADAKAYEIKVISQAIAESRKLLGGGEYEGGSFKIPAAAETSNQSLALPERSVARNEFQELRKQQNIESVCANAAEELKNESSVSESKPEPEWISHFFDIAEKVSTEDLQYWWGKILAGEIKQPGSFSLRTLDVLKNMSRQEAESFAKVGQYAFHSQEEGTFFINPNEYIFKKDDGLSISELLTLREAGLVIESAVNIFFEVEAGSYFQIFYGSLVLLLEAEKNIRIDSFNPGILTKAGIELLKLISIKPDMEYLKFVANKFKQDGMKIAWAPILKKRKEEGKSDIGEKTYLAM
jgi:hypothetical protein